MVYHLSSGTLGYRVRAWAAPHRPRDRPPVTQDPSANLGHEEPLPFARKQPNPCPRRASAPRPAGRTAPPLAPFPRQREMAEPRGKQAAPTRPPGVARFEPAGPPDAQASAARPGGKQSSLVQIVSTVESSPRAQSRQSPRPRNWGRALVGYTQLRVHADADTIHLVGLGRPPEGTHDG